METTWVVTVEIKGYEKYLIRAVTAADACKRFDDDDGTTYEPIQTDVVEASAIFAEPANTGGAELKGG